MGDESRHDEELTTIFVRRSGNGPDFKLYVSLTETVLMVKERLSVNGWSAEGHRLIYSGVILKDEKTLDEYDIVEGSVIHLIKLAKSNEQTAISGPIRKEENPEEAHMKSLFGNPIMKKVLDNPDILKAMVMSNPKIKEILDRNPEYSSILLDPSFLREGIEVANNPQKMKEALRHSDLAISNLEMQPGGWNHLVKLYESIHAPVSKSEPDSSTEEKNRYYAELFGVTDPGENSLNSEALPNPWNKPNKPKFPRNFPKDFRK